MYRKIRSGFLAIIFLVCLILIASVEAQLNFSTGWGKRSQKIRGESRATECISYGRPSPSLEQLLNVYNFIQIEARRILDCQKPNK